ncbi:MAG: hypothetical protein QOG35_1012 [Solirubrobacteraceae bacterium]|jgi:hypothetical protein|nr:hypothetical protein [Solirubrobacteraceae bacterium]
MFERFHRRSVAATAAALLAALGVGGVAMAQSSGSSTPAPTTQKPAPSQAQTPAPSQAPATPSQEVPGQESTAPENSATDPDNVQQGDQGSATGTAAASGTAASSGTDQPDAAGDTADAGTEQPGSEQPGNDGPGGHADEPGNPSADHQAQGSE